MVVEIFRIVRCILGNDDKAFVVGSKSLCVVQSVCVFFCFYYLPGENRLILPRMTSFKVVLVLIRPLDCINEF